MAGRDAQPAEGEVGVGLLDGGWSAARPPGRARRWPPPRPAVRPATPRGSGARCRPPPRRCRTARPAWMHSSVRRPMTRSGAAELGGGQLGRAPGQLVGRGAEARHDHAAEEPAVGGDAVERGGGAEVDHDGVGPVELDRGEGVDDPVGADAQRLVHVEPDRQRGRGRRPARRCSRWSARCPRRRSGSPPAPPRRGRRPAPRWASGPPRAGSRRSRCPTRPACGPGLVVSRQCASSSAPRKRPTVISVLPMSRVRSMIEDPLWLRSPPARRCRARTATSAVRVVRTSSAPSAADPVRRPGHRRRERAAARASRGRAKRASSAGVSRPPPASSARQRLDDRLDQRLGREPGQRSTRATWRRRPAPPATRLAHVEADADRHPRRRRRPASAPRTGSRRTSARPA